MLLRRSCFTPFMDLPMRAYPRIVMLMSGYQSRKVACLWCSLVQKKLQRCISRMRQRCLGLAALLTSSILTSEHIPKHGQQERGQHSSDLDESWLFQQAGGGTPSPCSLVCSSRSDSSIMSIAQAYCRRCKTCWALTAYPLTVGMLHGNSCDSCVRTSLTMMAKIGTWICEIALCDAKAKLTPSRVAMTSHKMQGEVCVELGRRRTWVRNKRSTRESWYTQKAL